MQYLYHIVPPDMEGTILYPLNELKTRFPHLYRKHVRKYAGRERLLERKLPILGNCLWNDVLFLTAIHPAYFRRKWEVENPPLWRYRFYQFEVGPLEPSNLGALTYNSGTERNFELFDPLRMKEYASIPDLTIQHWRKMSEAGERPFLFSCVPHILYRGPLDTTHASVVEG